MPNKPRLLRPPWLKVVECPECHTERMVRKDSASVVCKPCAGKRGQAAALIVVRAKIKKVLCKTCGTGIPARLGWKYCSVLCRVAGKRIVRICKCCGTAFSIFKSALSGKTNASGNFCCRPCYEKWMCRTDRETGRGSRWDKARKEALRRMPFCAWCGTRRRLQVHHLAPFRLSHDNAQNNLIPLCVTHHKVIECTTNEIEAIGTTPEDMTFVMGTFMRLRAAQTANVLRCLVKARANAVR